MGRFLLKWVLAPVAAGALGYGILGPQLAGDPKLRRKVQEGMGRVVPNLGAQEEPVKTDAPRVRVDVKPVGG